jgi:hypothetical protein
LNCVKESHKRGHFLYGTVKTENFRKELEYRVLSISSGPDNTVDS